MEKRTSTDGANGWCHRICACCIDEVGDTILSTLFGNSLKKKGVGDVNRGWTKVGDSGRRLHNWGRHALQVTTFSRPLQGHHTSLEGGCISSANPVRNYKCSWALVNDTSGPSQADFASTHMNLPFFVNYIWFIILRVNYNYVGKLQLVIIDCGQVWSIVWIVINCLNCDQLPELQSIAWIAINCLNCNQLPELQSIAWIAIDYMSCDRLYELRSIVWVATLSNHFANWKRLYSIS